MPALRGALLATTVADTTTKKLKPMILNTLRQGWQQQPSANTKRGKPHRATLKAGLWDEPPQLARALATGI